ncbi:MAG: hypothetical protein IJT90_00645 [Bacteroidaceae bacterium]|nr:hypothetical protein [Bacteroidaceae bacterium]
MKATKLKTANMRATQVLFMFMFVLLLFASCKDTQKTEEEVIMRCTSCGREMSSNQGSSLCESCEMKIRYEQEQERAAELEQRRLEERINRNYEIWQNARRNN